MAVRRWFAGEMAADGMAVTSDAAANVFGRFGPAEGPCVMAGSHLDTVPEGGAFDGALGVAVALECVRTMRDGGIAPATAIEVVATAEEEGRFGGMLGSQAIAGQVSREWLAAAADAEGVTLAEAMARAASTPRRCSPAAARPGPSAPGWSFMSSRGRRSKPRAFPSASPIRFPASACCSSGSPASPTTPARRRWTMRADAFAGLAEIATSIPALISDAGTDQTRITIGKVEVRPNFAHTIPGEVEFTVVLRDTDET